MKSIEKLSQAARNEFIARFGMEPVWITAAPGRVNLIGEHTDYNGGFVFPMAIERWTVIAAGPRQDSNPTALFYSQQMNASAEILLEKDPLPKEKPDWTSYAQGTVSCSLKKGLDVKPFCAVILSDVPLGGGLSSSASLEVAIATLMEEMSEKCLTPTEKPLLCQEAEHRFAKMPCGIMDQFISALAVKNHAMLLDCRAQTWDMIPMDDPEVVVLITNSNVKHTLTGSEYPERRASCEKAAKILGVSLLRETNFKTLEMAKNEILAQEKGEQIYRRARHFLTEEERTRAFAAALTAKNWVQAGEIMYAGHTSLRDDYEVSCPEIDILVEIAKSIGVEGGVYGSRITGGGFGGCSVTLAARSLADSIQERIREEYLRKTGIEPTLFTTRPAQGACILK